MKYKQGSIKLRAGNGTVSAKNGATESTAARRATFNKLVSEESARRRQRRLDAAKREDPRVA